MADVISEYQKWKQQGETLRAQAKQAIETRFRELMTEAVSLAEEYRSDFGAVLKPPSNVTAFRYKSGKSKSKKAPRAEKAHVPARSEPKEHKPDPKTIKLQRQLTTAKKKLEDAKAAAAPTRAIEDRIYEIEDALKLARQ